MGAPLFRGASVVMSPSSPPHRLKPRLRGVFHAAAGVSAIPATALLVRHAQPGPSTVAAVCYGISLVLVFGTSGLYHTPMWSLRARRKLRRLDHAMIYWLIAGSYAPFALQLDPAARTLVLCITVGGAILGFVKVQWWEWAPRWLTTAFYLGMGWCMVPFFPQLLERIGTGLFATTLLGGVCYTLGALIYWKRFPNPWPTVFGYHEVNHCVGLCGAGAHYYTIWQMLG